MPDGDNPMDKDGKPLVIKDKRTGEMVLARRTKPMIGCPVCAKQIEDRKSVV